MPQDFHSDPAYRKDLSLITKGNWKEGIYQFKIKPLISRNCKNPSCKKLFQVKPSNPKIFCSKKCAAIVHNTGRKMSVVTKKKISQRLSFLYKTEAIVNANNGIKDQKFRNKHTKRAIINKKINNKIRFLYVQKKLSMRQVGQRLHLNMWAVRSKMKRAGIPRRTISEAEAINFSRKPLSYNTKKSLSPKEELLHQAAVMLYWAEGAKKSALGVNFTNSNPNMVYLFLKALRTIYRVDEKRISGQLYCYSNQDSDKLMDYWSKILNLPRSQFTKAYVRQDFKIEKKGTLPYGVFHIKYSDKKLVMQIMSEIDIIQRSLTS